MSSHRGFLPPVTGQVCGVNAARVSLTIGEAQVVGERNVPAILCHVRMTSKGIRGFVRVCQQKSIQIRPAGTGGMVYIPDVDAVSCDCAENGNAWECVGTAEALTYLAEHPSVTEWDFLHKHAGNLDCRASGSTKKK